MADVEIKGMRELYTALSTQIPRKMEGKLLQKALAAGTAEIVKRARANIRGQVPDDFMGPTNKRYPMNRTGTLRRAIYAARGKTSDATKEVRIVNVRRGRRASKRGIDAFYARMVEYGHRIAPRGRLMRDTTATTKKGFDRYQRRLVSSNAKLRIKGDRGNYGRAEPKPFMRPAWDSGQRVALERVYEKLRDVIAAAISGSRF